MDARIWSAVFCAVGLYSAQLDRRDTIPPMPTFKERYRDLQELVKEHTILRAHNMKFKEGAPQDTILMFSEGLVAVVIMERFVRIILGDPKDQKGKPLTLYPLLQKAVDDEVLTLPHSEQEEGIKEICAFRNGLLHGNFEQVATRYGTDVLGYFKTRFAGEIEAMFTLDDRLMWQIDPETGERYVAQISATIDVPTHVIGQLCLDLTDALGAPVPPPRTGTALMSGDAPSWITLILDRPVASILLGSAIAFGKKLVELGAVDLWANKAAIAAKMKEAGASVFENVTRKLWIAAKASGSKARLGVASRHDQAVLALPSGTEEASLALALLVLRAAELRQLLRDDVGPKSRGPFVNLTLDKDGTFVVSWFDGTEWVERRLPLVIPE